MELHSTQPPLQRLSGWLKTTRGKTIALGLVVLVAVGSAAVVTYGRYARERQANGDGPASSLPFSFDIREEKKDERAPGLLDGVMTDVEHAKRRPLAIMIENHPEARPQSGLDQASVVFEAIAEGGITRFLALFGTNDAEKVGPVRSARPYFVEFASGWKALYAHAGGSQGALALIPKTPLVDLPHNATAFHREPRAGIASEHTLFTETGKLYDYAKDKGASTESDLQSWQFNDDPDTASRPASQTVVVDFSSPSYKVEWAYDSAGDTYKRSMAGTPHKDAVSGDQLTAETVAVITVVRHTDPNSNQGKGEVTMDTTGSGKAVVLTHGTATNGTWKKAALDQPIKFLDDQGNELKLGRGRTWIEVIHNDTPVSIE